MCVYSLISFYFSLSKFFRWTLISFIIYHRRTNVFIFINLFTTFQPICFSPFFRCVLTNSGAYRWLRVESFIYSSWVDFSNPINNGRVQVLSDSITWYSYLKSGTLRIKDKDDINNLNTINDKTFNFRFPDFQMPIFWLIVALFF